MGGVLPRQDLADYEPTFGEPLTQTFRDVTLACVATPSGAVTNLETLGILHQLDLDAHRSPKFGGKSENALSFWDERDTTHHHRARRRHPAAA
jgi:gamma-glutamyltranspeptidase